MPRTSFSCLFLPFSPLSCSCSECDRRFNSEILLEYHKDEFDHWSEDDLPYDSEDSDWDSLREVMNEEKEEEPEFGPGEEEREMLL